MSLIRNAAAAAGLELFKIPNARGLSLSDRADAMLNPRGNGYFGRESRKQFGSRVLRLATAADGFVIVALESLPRDTPTSDEPYDTTTVYRAVVADCTGRVLQSPMRSDCTDESSDGVKQFVDTVKRYNEAAQFEAVNILKRRKAALGHEMKRIDDGLYLIDGPEAEPLEFTRLTNDVNGNPRYVCHFLNLCTRAEVESSAPVHSKYAMAVKRANALGGRRYNTRLFGGGLVFQSYSLHLLARDIGAAVGRKFIPNRD